MKVPENYICNLKKNLEGSTKESLVSIKRTFERSLKAKKEAYEAWVQASKEAIVMIEGLIDENERTG